MRCTLFGSIRTRAVVTTTMILFGGLSAHGQQQIAKLTAHDASQSAWFGRSVCISGNTAIVGASGDSHTGQDSGAAYMYRMDSDGLWEQLAKLTADDLAEGDWFGISVSISGDIAIVGSRNDGDAGSNSGSAYIFRDVNGVWQQVAKLTAGDAAASDLFGHSVAISGGLAVVGAWGDDDAGSSSGSAYIFRDDNGVWQQIAKLTADDGYEQHRFGWSVAISGETAVIGTRHDNHAGPFSGAVYVFREINDTWQQVAKLIADDAEPEDFFGYHVAINGDTIVVGAWGSDDACPKDPECQSGAAYVFSEVEGVWQQVATLVNKDATGGEQLGVCVSISGDTIIAGANGYSADQRFSAGAAFVFRKVNGIWHQTARLEASDGAALDNLGLSASVNETGEIALVGAPMDDDGGSFSGSAYVFSLDTSIAAEVTDFTIQFGTLLGGDLQSLLESDDQRVVIRSAIGFSALEPNIMELRVFAETPIESPESLDIGVESRINHPTGVATVRLRNQSTNAFNVIGQYAIGFTEKLVEIDDVSAAGLVSGDGQIELSLKHVVLASFSALGFDSSIDLVSIRVE